MTDPEEQQAIDRVKQLVFQTVRDAVASENAVAWQALLQPIVQSFDRRFTEIERSLGLLIQGQALIEKSLAGAFDDPTEDWKSAD
jgi:hypothetical protein